MLTVLIIEPDGNERIREDAVEVRRLFHPVKKNNEVVTEAGILIRWDDGIETHFGKDSTQGIYVMNRHGATVANYRP